MPEAAAAEEEVRAAVLLGLDDRAGGRRSGRRSARTSRRRPGVIALTRSMVSMVTFPVPRAEARYVLSRLRLPWLLP